MDHANLFDTPTINRLHRLEYVAALVVCVVLVLLHRDQVRLLVGLGLFAYIDVFGYLPGLVAFLRSPDGRVPASYYVAYNVMHSAVSMGVVAGLWAVLVAPEWALMAIPIHLCIDRGLFGNTLKPFGVSFEPRAHPAYRALTAALAGAPRWAGTEAPRPAAEPNGSNPNGNRTNGNRASGARRPPVRAGSSQRARR